VQFIWHYIDVVKKGVTYFSKTAGKGTLCVPGTLANIANKIIEQNFMESGPVNDQECHGLQL